jgi:hypothetical protein
MLMSQKLETGPSHPILSINQTLPKGCVCVWGGSGQGSHGQGGFYALEGLGRTGQWALKATYMYNCIYANVQLYIGIYAYVCACVIYLQSIGWS